MTHDPDSETLGRVDAIWVNGTLRKIDKARGTQRGWLVALEGVVTRNDAEALRGQKVEVDREALGLGDEDVLLGDLIGCAVKLVDGRAWGTIAGVEADVQDRLVIHDGEIERLLPLVDEFVKDVDLKARVITIDPPEGLPESKIVRR